MVAGSKPFSDVPAVFLEVADGQADQLRRRFLGRERSADLDRLADHAVETPYGIGGVNDRRIAGSKAKNGMTSCQGPELNDVFLRDSFHQDGGERRGNISFGARIGAAAARNLGHYPADDTTIASAVLQPGGAEIVVSLSFAAAGALSCAAPAAVTGFEVAGSRSGFTAAVSGDAVVLTKVSGTWAGGEAITYLHGYPVFYGTSVDQATLLDGLLYETYSNDYAGLGLPVRSYAGLVV